MKYQQNPATGTLLLIGLGALAGIFILWGTVLPESERGYFQEQYSTDAGDAGSATSATDNFSVTVVARDLSIPWEIVFLPDESMLITERPGTIKIIEQSGITKSIALEGVEHTGEGGLLGAALHPDFENNSLVYVYRTVQEGFGTENEVVRYRLEGETLSDPESIISGIPGASYHDGGRIAFGPDGMLYITTGDAGDSDSAQDRDALSGKILRLTPDGTIPDDNPFKTPVYSYGHRNPQGLAWDDSGQLWATEHGRSGLRSGFDELNRIEAGGNYGWPEIQGDESQEGMIRPTIHSGPQTTWAPAGLVFSDGALYFAGLRGTSLYRAALSEDGSVEEITTPLRDTYGRLRAVVIGPDGALYISTSNTDGRGNVREDDDKILRVEL